MRAPRILVFDSGLGGLTVYDEIMRLRPHAHYLYAADDDAFPYGRLSESQVIARVETVMSHLIADFSPDIVVIACNTASTLVLPVLRSRWQGLPFVGTVPAIKPAAECSRSGLITVLATPGTVARDYTQALIRAHAAHCLVHLVGSQKLAALAEASMRGNDIDENELVNELAPCFIEAGGRRTDVIVLACTHYPLLLPHFLRLAGAQVGWPVEFINPAPAIARRTDHLLSLLDHMHAGPPSHGTREVVFTSGAQHDEILMSALGRFGLQALRRISRVE